MQTLDAARPWWSRPITPWLTSRCFASMIALIERAGGFQSQRDRYDGCVVWSFMSGCAGLRAGREGVQHE